MKILIIRKRFIKSLIFFTVLFILSLSIFYLTTRKFETKETLYPINISQDIKYDLTGDGNKEVLELINNQNRIDFNIKTNTSDFYLSKQTPDKILFNQNLHWKPEVFIHDLSRDNIPELLLFGSKNNKSTYYIFHWNKDKFELLLTDNKNIFGILDSKNTKTPQCFSLNSSEGTKSLNSFMIINNTVLDTTTKNQSLPTLDSVTNFINLIELPYELDELPNIFSSKINKDELSLLWNLDKENSSYAFQNAFFYDYDWDDYGQPTTFKWRLSFEKSKLKGMESDKNEMILLIDLIKDDNSYKITSIQKSN